MTAILQKVLDKAGQLPEKVQKQLAEQLLEDIEGELQWDRTLEGSQSQLEKMAKKADEARRKGKTVRKGFDEL